MGLFSFGNKDARPRREASGESSRSRVARGERQTRRESRRPQEAMLDPTLPEKQRARRRLVGAVALVLAAVIVLPMVLDSHPKPVTDDIAISIPESDNAHAAAALRSTVAAGTAQAGSSVDAGVAPPPLAPAAGASAAMSSGANGRMASSYATARPAPAKATPAPAAAAAPQTTTQAADDAAPGSRFIVQLGSFSSEAPARDWAAKLKALGVPAYLQHVRQSDGSDRVLLRAGPFADRTAAEGAVRKVRAAGLASQQG